jgi:hypothetical protein
MLFFIPGLEMLRKQLPLGARMADKITARKVMLATGHKTEAVFAEYADHVLETDRLEVAVTTGEVFAGLLPEKFGEDI